MGRKEKKGNVKKKRKEKKDKNNNERNSGTMYWHKDEAVKGLP